MKRPGSILKSPLLQEDGLLLILFAILALLLYYPAREAGFVTDFSQYPQRFAGRDWTGIFSSFGFPGVQPLTMAIAYALYKTWGISPLPWYILFSCLHALNAGLLFSWLKRYLILLKFEKPGIAALLAASLFLLCPYASEPVVWKNDLQYLLCSAFFFFSLLALNRYLQKPTLRAAWILALLFGASLLSFELSLGGPAIYLLLAWYYWRKIGGKKPFGSYLPGILYGPLLAIILYFLLTLLQTGKLVPHYGAATHLHFDPAQIGANYLHYFLKYLLDLRFWEHNTKGAIRTFIERGSFLLPFFGILLGLYIPGTFFFKKLAAPLQAGLVLVACFGAALLPLINLYFYDLGYLENDRYGYLAGAFIYAWAAICISRIRGPLLGVVAIPLLAIQGFFLLKMNFVWRESTQVYKSLIDNYPWQEAPEIYILAMPDNLRGALLFRDLKGDNAFRDAYTLIAGKGPLGKIREIAQYNMNSAEEGVKGWWKDERTAVLEFRQWGNWWWRGGIGMGDWSTEDFEVKAKGQQYEISFRKRPEHARFIYQDGTQWIELPAPPAAAK